MANLLAGSEKGLPIVLTQDASTSTGPSARHQLDRAVSQFGLQVISAATSMVVTLDVGIASSSDATMTTILTWSCEGTGTTLWQDTSDAKTVTAFETVQNVAATSAGGLGATVWVTGK